MNKRIEYRNALGKVIESPQKPVTEEYYKYEYLENSDFLKIKIHYLGDVVNEGTYFMESHEVINDVITRIDQTHRWSIMTDLQIINGYYVWKDNYYQNGEISDVYSKTVFKSNGDVVASMGFDANHQPTRGCSKRFDLSGKNIIDDGDVVGVFDEGDFILIGFGSDGSFKAWSSNDLFDESYDNLSNFMEEQQGGCIFSLMTPEMITYYTNFQPLVPPFQL